MNILFLADPGSVHDVKWMSYLSVGHTCHLIVRKHHAAQMGVEKLRAFERTNGIRIIAQVEDFSIRRFGRTWSTAKELARLIRANGIDVFHMMYAEPNALWAFFRRTLAVPILLTTRGTDVLKTIPAFYQRKSLLDRSVAWCYWKALRQVDQVTCTSTRQSTAVKELSGDPQTFSAAQSSGAAESAAARQIWVQNAGLVWVPVLAFLAVAAALVMNNLPQHDCGPALSLIHISPG